MKGKKTEYNFLKALQQIKKTDRPALLGNLNDKGLESIYQVIANVLKSNKISPNIRKKAARQLLPVKNKLRYLAKKNNSKIRKKKLLTKIGGGDWLDTILTIAIPLIISLL